MISANPIRWADSGTWSWLVYLAGWVLLFNMWAAAQIARSAATGDSSNQDTLAIPVGTILPVKIDHGFTSKNAKTGQPITARVMQDVPLPNGRKIPAGAKVIGTVLSSSPTGSGTGGRISARFDQLEVHHRRAPIVTDLRALASCMEVDEAGVPETSIGFGTPYAWATTRQIGGDEKYGVGSVVTDQDSRTVGIGLDGGVLVHVRAKPGTKCRGPMDGEDRLQALWVFSSDACGVYGMLGTTISHAGRTEPVGEFELSGEKSEVKVRGGSGALLRVVRKRG